MECFNTIFRENSRIRWTGYVDQKRRLPIWTVSERILVSLSICTIILKSTVCLPRGIFFCCLKRNSKNGFWKTKGGVDIEEQLIRRTYQSLFIEVLRFLWCSPASFRNGHLPIRVAGANSNSHILLGGNFVPMEPVFLPISFARESRICKISSHSPFSNCINDHLYQ